MTRTKEVIRPLNLSKEVVEPHLAKMRARMELGTESAAFALGMLLTPVYFETAIALWQGKFLLPCLT